MKSGLSRFVGFMHSSVPNPTRRYTEKGTAVESKHSCITFSTRSCRIPRDDILPKGTVSRSKYSCIIRTSFHLPIHLPQNRDGGRGRKGREERKGQPSAWRFSIWCQGLKLHLRTSRNALTTCAALSGRRQIIAAMICHVPCSLRIRALLHLRQLCVMCVATMTILYRMATMIILYLLGQQQRYYFPSMAISIIIPNGGNIENDFKYMLCSSERHHLLPSRRQRECFSRMATAIMIYYCTSTMMALPSIATTIIPWVAYSSSMKATLGDPLDQFQSSIMVEQREYGSVPEI